MTNQLYTRRGETQKIKIRLENKKGNIPEFISGSSTHAVAKQASIGQLDVSFYRLGLGPTGAASKPENSCHEAAELSGSHLTYKCCQGVVPTRSVIPQVCNAGYSGRVCKSGVNPTMRTVGLTPNLQQHAHGFTLIELLVVVLIIGILAAIALPQYTFAVEKARLSEALTVVNSLEKATDAWKLTHGNPTEQILFLGDNANGKGQLDIDVTNGMDCSLDEGKRCGNKNFSFWATCYSDSCTVFFSRLTTNGNAYSITRMKNNNISQWKGDECDYYPDVAPYGKKICEMLAAQGDGYFACEDC